MDKKIKRCKYSLPHFKDGKFEHHCIVNGFSDKNVKLCTTAECENCSRFNSRYIEYPITVNDIVNKPIENHSISAEIGSIVEIRPCGEKYQDKSYIGIFLGDLPIAINSSFNKKSGILSNSTIDNPAIFVLELKEIIYGCESWWRAIESVDDFNGITDEDINNTWYVKLLKNTLEK